MEKLLDLLQEFYGDNRTFSNENWLLTMTNWVENISGAYAQTYIISLQGWFIKWLVDNDKIDRTDIPTWFDYEYQWRKGIYCVSYEVNILTMRLSIQDEPIQFLCSILK